MSLVLAVLLVAVLLGWARGGSLERLGGLTLRSRALVPVALVVQVAGTLVGGRAYPAGLVVSALLVLLFLARNRGVRGTGLVGLGLVANAVVVAANGAMPVSVEASGRAGVTVQAIVAGEDPRHVLLEDGTRLPLLADVVPVPLPRLPQVVSPGDVLVAAGVGQLVVLGMGTGLTLRRRRPRPDAGRDWLRGGVRPG